MTCDGIWYVDGGRVRLGKASIRKNSITRISQQIHVQLANKPLHVLIVSKTSVHNNDMHIINFMAYLFLYFKFSCIQLTLKIYYRQNKV